MNLNIVDSKLWAVFSVYNVVNGLPDVLTPKVHSFAFPAYRATLQHCFPATLGLPIVCQCLASIRAFPQSMNVTRAIKCHSQEHMSAWWTNSIVGTQQTNRPKTTGQKHHRLVFCCSIIFFNAVLFGMGCVCFYWTVFSAGLHFLHSFSGSS